MANARQSSILLQKAQGLSSELRAVCAAVRPAHARRPAPGPLRCRRNGTRRRARCALNRRCCSPTAPAPPCPPSTSTSTPTPFRRRRARRCSRRSANTPIRRASPPAARRLRPCRSTAGTRPGSSPGRGTRSCACSCPSACGRRAGWRSGSPIRSRCRTTACARASPRGTCGCATRLPRSARTTASRSATTPMAPSATRSSRRARAGRSICARRPPSWRRGRASSPRPRGAGPSPARTCGTLPWC